MPTLACCWAFETSNDWSNWGFIIEPPVRQSSTHDEETTSH